MRDINRIDTFCDELKEVWKKVPDWRFMQLMSNFFGYSFSEKGKDPFFMEEDSAIKELKDYMEYLFGGE